MSRMQLAPMRRAVSRVDCRVWVWGNRMNDIRRGEEKGFRETLCLDVRGLACMLAAG